METQEAGDTDCFLGGEAGGWGLGGENTPCLLICLLILEPYGWITYGKYPCVLKLASDICVLVGGVTASTRSSTDSEIPDGPRTHPPRAVRPWATCLNFSEPHFQNGGKNNPHSPGCKSDQWRTRGINCEVQRAATLGCKIQLSCGTHVYLCTHVCSPKSRYCVRPVEA